MEENNKENVRIYELGYLLAGTMPEGDVAPKVGMLKSLIEDRKGVSISEEFPRLITLAYEMSRPVGNKKTWFKEGYFGWMKFEIEPAEALALEPILRRDEDLIRFLLIKTVRENTIAGKRTLARADYKRSARRAEAEDAKPVDEVEIEKKLEELAQAE